MDKTDIIKYYTKIIMVYRKGEKAILNENFGTKQNWERYFEETKNNDKNLGNFVNYLIDLGVLKDVGINIYNNKIYRPDEEGAIKCQKLIEDSKPMRIIEMLYDVDRNNKKGAFSL